MLNNILRNGFYLLAVGTIGLLAPACTDLEVEGTDSIINIDEGGAAVPGDPAAVLESIESGMGFYGDQANLYSLYTHVSDEMIPPTRGVDWGDNGVWRTLHAHTWDPTHAFVLNTWNQLNGRVFQTVEVLAGSPDASQKANAQFYQALFMWHVLDLYGQVPFREFDQGVDELPKTLSRSEATEIVIANLEEALPNLPSAGPGNNTSPTKAAAYNLLSRVYLNRGVYTAADATGPYEFSNDDMAAVVRNADLLTGEGYRYDDDYFSIWEEGSDSEPIFVTTQNNGSNRWFMTLHYSQNPSGWNGFTTLADFYNQFDEDDVRIGESATPDGSAFSAIGTGFLTEQQLTDDGEILIDSRTQRPLDFTAEVPLAGAPTDAGFRVIKYHPARSGAYIIMRYSEAMLNKAEAMLRMGDSDGALDVVNEMREARGIPTLSGIDMDGMLAERGFEMYWEGMRRMDQVRFGTYADTWAEKTVTDPNRVLFPIPQQALDSNPNLQQNPGY